MSIQDQSPELVAYYTKHTQAASDRMRGGLEDLAMYSLEITLPKPPMDVLERLIYDLEQVERRARLTAQRMRDRWLTPVNEPTTPAKGGGIGE